MTTRQCSRSYCGSCPKQTEWSKITTPTRRKPKKNEKLKIIPLGGAGEIGKNMLVFEYGDAILVVDSGLAFPEEEMPGVDIVIPDTTYLKENAERVLGIVLTHGHEDHIGALPYVLRNINVPIWGTKLTLGLVSAKLGEHGLLDSTELNEVRAGETIEVGPFSVEFIRVSHSVPDAVTVAVRSPVGVVIATSDFKFDHTPVDGRPIDIARLARLGEEGVLALLSDCTNSEKPGYTPSERLVGVAFDEIFATAPGRVIVATFASNIHRVQQMADTAVKYNRKVALIGRSMAQNCEIAEKLGYLHIPPENKLRMEDIESEDPSRVAIMTTGSQGEPLSALTRMAMEGHKKVKITEGDTVVISATPIPGNEALIIRTINHLFRLGANVLYDEIRQVHVSGHGNQEDLKMMLNLVKPMFVIPMHGEIRHIVKYREIAKSLGFTEEHIVTVSIGDILETAGQAMSVTGKIPDFGTVMVDGIGVGDVGDEALRDRRHLAQDGIILVVLSIDKNTGEIVAGPDIISRGFAQEEQAEGLLEEARERILEVVRELDIDEVTEWQTVKPNVRSALAKFLYERTRRRPMVVPVIMEI